MGTAQLSDIQVDLPYAQIADLCQHHHVAELSIFGSVLRPDFNSKSDIDFLVRFQDDDLGPWMSKIIELAVDLERLLNRPVDLVDKISVAQSENYIRRGHILSTAKVLYVT